MRIIALGKWACDNFPFALLPKKLIFKNGQKMEIFASNCPIENFIFRIVQDSEIFASKLYIRKFAERTATTPDIFDEIQEAKMYNYLEENEK